MKCFSLIVGLHCYKREITHNNVVIFEERKNRFVCHNIGSEHTLHTLEHALHYVSSPSYSLIIEHVYVVSRNMETIKKCFLDERCKTVYEVLSNITHVPVHIFKATTHDRYTVYERFLHPEVAYLELLKDILDNGELRGDRTKIGTRALFGTQLKFDLGYGFPLLTTKKVFFRAVFEELIWFLNGNTNSMKLSEKGIHIWDDNGTREFLDGRNLTEYPEGELGPIYGFQWRHWGSEYSTTSDNHVGGIDQLLRVIDQIQNDSNSRRIIMSSWNVSDLDKMALPPCHILVQFQVTTDKRLNCSVYQRSADMGLGVPFNIASYALLTHFIAHTTNLSVGTLTMSFGDTHIYLNHIEGLKRQLERHPREFPTLELSDQEKMPWEWTFEDIAIKNYNPYESIKLKMAV